MHVVLQVEEIANIAANNKLFGGNCTVPRVLQEMMSECGTDGAVLRAPCSDEKYKNSTAKARFLCPESACMPRATTCMCTALLYAGFHLCAQCSLFSGLSFLS